VRSSLHISKLVETVATALKILNFFKKLKTFKILAKFHRHVQPTRIFSLQAACFPINPFLPKQILRKYQDRKLNEREKMASFLLNRPIHSGWLAGFVARRMIEF